jgi:5-methylcytosine-specific restriction protein A
MSTATSVALEPLRPQRNEAVMDLVSQAGIDVAPWAQKKGGGTVRNPRANPHYCYEWAFGGEPEPTALCVWHSSLQEDHGTVAYEGNLREFALNLDRIAIDRGNPSEVRERARGQGKRARKFDSRLQRAFRRSFPVRIILLVGETRAREELGWDTSKVRFRKLDTVPWFVERYSDDDGSFRIVRKPLATTPNSLAPELPSVPAYVDQYSLPDAARRQETRGTGYARSATVRQAVLQRASGVCEMCTKPGFKMDGGAVYLETRHVVPLCDDGPDIEWNVVAICPNDHRRAHFAEDRAAIQSILVDVLLDRFPAASDALSTLIGRTDGSEGSL